LPVGIRGVALAGRLLRERRADHPPEWDVGGLLLAPAGFGALLYAVSMVGERGWASPAVVGTLAAGVAALVALAVVEHRVASPLLDLRLFRRRTFLVATLVGYATVVAFFGAEFLLPLYLQSLRGRTALQAGVTLLPLALGAGLTMPVAGKLYDRLGPRPLVVAGFALLLYNTWSLAHLTATTPLGFIVALMAVRGLALGLAVQTPFTAALASVSSDAAPRASSLVISTRLAVQAVGVAVLATLLGSGAREPGAVHLAGFARAYTLTFWLAAIALALGTLLPGWPGRWDAAAQGSD
jgi:DHA2 family multidrug resistance protein